MGELTFEQRDELVDKFEVACTYEHTRYVLTWSAAFFGPELQVTSFASCQLPEKGIAVGRMPPDFTTGCIAYPGGVVARVTCSVVAPADKSMTIIGDDGITVTANVRNDVSPVCLFDESRRAAWRRNRAANQYIAALARAGSFSGPIGASNESTRLSENRRAGKGRGDIAPRQPARR